MNISITRTNTPKPKPTGALGFGKYFSDHMFLMDFSDGAWHDPRIVPYAPLTLDPAAMVFHYAQEVFEGLKAYRCEDGRGIQLFRPTENIERMRKSCERLCIPPVDSELFLEALKALVTMDADWVPSDKDTSLYLRPFIIATEPHVGVHASNSYTFAIIACSVGAYYANGFNPVDIFVEKKAVRAVAGGTGEAKAGGNYAASLQAGDKAKKEHNCEQVLWLDGKEHTYIEEVGSMNVFFKIGDKVVTPELQGSILPGVTRKSCIEILRSWDITVDECKIKLSDIERASEAWGSGTAAVISPIGKIKGEDGLLKDYGGEPGKLTQRLYNYLTDIQWGREPDTFGWTVEV